jgi:diguanylate cyclase (GGDEF)-like protein
MLDLDGFKAINDTYGHAAGDAMLLCVANTLRANIRETDVPARLGGEEFGILLPNTEVADALILAERLRRAVEQTGCVVQEHSMRLTVSIGVAEYRPELLDLDGVLREADAAMYQAKNQGRNRVVLYR